MYRIRNFFLFIKRFCYYGYIGASKTYDFEAHGIHTLIHAHMVRVKRFMNSDKTHLLWNDKPDNKGMKKLAEFTELSKQMAEDEMRPNYYWLQIYNEQNANGLDYFDRINESTEADKKRCGLAFKKDNMISKQRLERYYYMLEKYTPGFWD